MLLCVGGRCVTPTPALRSEVEISVLLIFCDPVWEVDFSVCCYSSAAKGSR